MSISSLNNANSTRWWDRLAAFIFLAVALSAAARLVATHWTEHLELVYTLTILGTLAGLAIGRSSFSPQLAAGFSLAYGLFAIPWQVGLTLGDGYSWTARLVSLLGRLSYSAAQFIRKEHVTDPLLFLLLMALIYWTLSVFGGYTLVRHGHAWRATLPIGLTLVILHTYDFMLPRRAWYLASFLFFALMLVARVAFVRNQVEWKKHRTHLPIYIGFDLTKATVLAALLLIFISWGAPAIAATLPPAAEAWETLTEPWVKLRDRLGKMFTSLQVSVGVVNDYYGESLALGRGNDLSDFIVLTVEAPRPPSNVRYYWRLRTYDFYDNNQWSSTLPDLANVLPSSENMGFTAPPPMEGRWEAEFIFTVGTSITILYTPNQPLWVEIPAEAHLAYNSDGSVDLNTLKAYTTLYPGATYKVAASITNASVNQLRGADPEYPDWVVDRYLEVPDSVSERTLELARRITEGMDNPYDMTSAITQWMRDNVTYVDTVPTPPAGQDHIDWMLFDLKQGYCMYYASAEIIMLRSLGIPARLAVGYSSGERTLGVELLADGGDRPGGIDQIPDELDEGSLSEMANKEFYTVRQSNAHAWPEVYFPGIGWVEFEPTVNQFPLSRFQGAAETEDPLNSEDNTEAITDRNDDPLDRSSQENDLADEVAAMSADSPTSIGTWIAWVTLALVLILSPIIWQVLRRRGMPSLPALVESGLERFDVEPPEIIRRWVRFAKLPPLAKAYQEMNRALKRLGSPPKLSNTPAERAAALASLLPETEGPVVQLLLDEYHTGVFSPQEGNLEVAARAGNALRAISYMTLIRRFLSRWQSPKKKPSFAD